MKTIIKCIIYALFIVSGIVLAWIQNYSNLGFLAYVDKILLTIFSIVVYETMVSKEIKK